MVPLRTILATANQMLPSFMAEYRAEIGDRHGGYMFIHCTADENMGTVGSLIGDVPPVKQSEKMYFAMEKVMRLSQRREAGSPDRTSAVTQNYKAHQYGGAIWIYAGFYISFSGFPPMYDSMFCLAVAKALELMDQEEAKSLFDEIEQHEHTGVDEK